MLPKQELQLVSKPDRECQFWRTYTPLVSHCRTPDLVGFERFFYFLHHCEMADVCEDALALFRFEVRQIDAEWSSERDHGLRDSRRLENCAYCCAERTERVADVEVDLARVRLGADGIEGFESSFLGNKLVKFFNLGVVAFEQSKEGSLAASGSGHVVSNCRSCLESKRIEQKSSIVRQSSYHSTREFQGKALVLRAPIDSCCIFSWASSGKIRYFMSFLDKLGCSWSDYPSTRDFCSILFEFTDPFTPRKRKSDLDRSRFLRSMRRSIIQRQALLPTVVSAA